jgi:zinc transporter ZupT
MSSGRLKGPAAVMLGFFGLYLLNRFLHVYLSRSDEMDVSYSIGLIPMLGIGLHSLLDGAIYSVTFNVSIFTGALAAVGMVLHEFPEGIITFVLLERGGFSRSRSMLYAFLAAAISTPAGALLSYPFIHRIEEPLLGILLALSGGALLYVGGPHLLPAVEQEPGRFKTLAVAAGVGVAMFIILSKH